MMTDAAPALPYVTGAATPPDDWTRLRAALDRVMADPDLAMVRGDLMIEGFADLSLDDYHVMLEMEAGAAAKGYPTLR